jgi:peptide/nickel transport system substrate-binding protein
MKRHPHRALPPAAAVVAAAALALSGCAGNADAGSSGSSGSSNTPVQGGVLKYRAAGGTATNDPASNTGYGLAVPVRAVADSLVWNKSDGSFSPWLATKWTVNSNATHYGFTLRKDVTFSDGEKLDAAAVKGSVESIVEGGAKYATANAEIVGLKKISTPTPYTVDFDFSAPNSSFLQAISSTIFGIVAPSTAKRGFAGRQLGTGIVGSGPFVISQSRGAEGYRLTRRADYKWPPKTAKNQGPAYLKEIDVQNIQDNSVAANDLRAGQLDLVHNVEPVDKTSFTKSKTITINRQPLPGSVNGFQVNPKLPALQDENVRKALSLAIDRKAVLARASAVDIPATSALARSNPYWTDQSSLIQTNVKQAEQLLDAAGWKAGPDGVRQKNGQKLSFSLIFSASTISHEPDIAVVQSQWKAIGVGLTFGPVTTAELNQRTLSGNYSFLWAGGTRPDADVLESEFGGVDPQLDTLFKQILAAPSLAKRKKLAGEASQIVLAKAYLIPLYDFIQPLSYRKTTHLPTYEATEIPWLGDAWVDRG